jgi:hypothetical protein
MKSFLIKFLFSFLLFINLFLLSYDQTKAVLCDWSSLNSSNCFPVSQAEELGINLNEQSGSWTYTYCQDGTSGSLEENVCINSFFNQELPSCPDSGYNCTLYQDALPPGPVAGGFLGCTVGSHSYSCCPNQNLIINGRCVSLEDWIILADQCCEAGQSSCTTQSGDPGYCSSYDGGFVCQGQGICTELEEGVDLDDPGDFWCNCTLGGTNWYCVPGASSTSQLSLGNETEICPVWSAPDLGQCSTTLPSNRKPSFCGDIDGGRCSGKLNCIAKTDNEGQLLKSHGEECTWSPNSDQCDTSLGLQCMSVEGTYKCAYPPGTRGGIGVSSSQSSCLWDFECATQVGIDDSPFNDFECVDANQIPCDASNASTQCSCRLPENRDYSCEWTSYDDADSEYFGRPAYCMYGFRTPEELRAADLVFDCEDNCGGLLLQFASWISGWDGQHVSMNGFEAGQSDDGTYYTCVTGDFDGSIKNTIESCLQDQGIATAVGGTAGAVVGAAIPGPNLVTIPVVAYGGAQVGSSIFNCAPTISGEVRLADGINACQANLRIEVDLSTEVGDLESGHDPYFICATNLAGNDTAIQNCNDCYQNQDGIWTSVGCISKDPTSIVSRIITIGVGILGGIFLLRILTAAFMLTTSQGDVKKTSEAKEIISEAIIGVLFVLFSVTILQFIGSDVLRLPAFGG